MLPLLRLLAKPFLAARAALYLFRTNGLTDSRFIVQSNLRSTRPGSSVKKEKIAMVGLFSTLYLRKSVFLKWADFEILDS